MHMQFGSDMKYQMVQMIDLHLTNMKHTQCQEKGVTTGRIQAGVSAQTNFLKNKNF